MTTAQRKNLAVYVGVLLVVLGVVLSATNLERTILPEGTIVGTSRRALAWGFCRILLIGLGAYFLVRRPRVTIVHLCAFIPAGVLSLILGVVFLQLFYVVRPPIISGWRSSPVAAEQNELGLRGRRISYSPDDFVILLLGDSQVESTALPFESMPEQLLESDLNSLGKRVKVFSVAAGGYGQDQQLLLLEEYLQKYRADLAVLWQTPENDTWNNVFPTHMINGNPKPTFWLEGGSLCGPSETMGQEIATSPIVVAALWKRLVVVPRRDKLWERRLPEPYSPLKHYEGPVDKEWQDRWDTNLGRMRDEELDIEKTHMAVLLAPRSKRMEYGLDLTRALTQRIQQVITSHNGKLVLFDVYVDRSDSADDEMYVLNGKYYRVSQRQFSENRNYVNQGFDTVDVPVTVKDWRVGPEDGHLNKQATEQVMRDLALQLKDRIPDKTP